MGGASGKGGAFTDSPHVLVSPSRPLPLFHESTSLLFRSRVETRLILLPSSAQLRIKPNSPTSPITIVLSRDGPPIESRFSLFGYSSSSPFTFSDVPPPLPFRLNVRPSLFSHHFSVPLLELTYPLFCRPDSVDQERVPRSFSRRERSTSNVPQQPFVSTRDQTFSNDNRVGLESNS